MFSVRLGLTLITMAALTACGDASSPDEEAALASGPGPWDTLAPIAPEDRPYGLDVYTAQCLSCHGNLGQGIAPNPALKGLSQTDMQKKLLAYLAGSIQGETAQAMTKAIAALSDAEIAAVAIYAGE